MITDISTVLFLMFTSCVPRVMIECHYTHRHTHISASDEHTAQKVVWAIVCDPSPDIIKLTSLQSLCKGNGHLRHKQSFYPLHAESTPASDNLAQTHADLHQHARVFFQRQDRFGSSPGRAWRD